MLSRTRLTSKYGDFNRLMENRDEHGGFGNVTWNVGPHVGPHPYGKDHHVVFVDRNKLLAGFKHRAPDEVERHAQVIGQQMDRGDVIHVPHVKFQGSAPDIDAKHAASLHAAAQRGAEKVPVVVHRDHQLALAMHAGGVQKPGAPLADQNKAFKWRWNGRAWYTKPSFNQGKCPPGTGADAGKDQCIGGGDPPKAEKQRLETPASLYGSKSLPDGRRRENPFAPAPQENKPKRKIVPPPPVAAPAAQAPAQPAQPPKAPKAPSGPIAPPIARNDIAPHTAANGGQGLDARIFGGRYEVQESMKRSGQQAAEALKTKAPHLKIGQLYGCGLSGCAYAGPEDPDGTPTVVKMDKGENEATMARLLLKHKDLGKLSSVPRYIEAIDTGVKDKFTGMKVYAIHREDLRDFSSAEKDLKRFFGGFGMDLHDRLSSRAASYTRQKLVDKYNQMEEEYRQKASRSPEVAKQFERVAADTRKLIERGIVPCDLHHENWGVRDKTGEVVMRDVGCSHFARDLA